MLFNSLDYFLFLTIVLIAARVVYDKVTLRVVFLLLASYVFYASNNGWLIVLILLSTCIDYFAGLTIERTKLHSRKNLALLTSVVANLSILGYYKYIDFFRQSISAFAASWGIELGWVDLNIILPVGISFYTFQSMSYTIDVYRGTIRAESSWIKFAFYVAYFPQLIAGPIMRASYFLPQVQRVQKLTLDDVESGVFLICRGLVKKIVLADFLALYADRAFTLGPGVSSLDLFVGLYAFTFQIYFDFSGYTDIAIGSSRLMGYRIPDNFNRPYAAVGFSDFWRRWHISLSSWLRDYLYISIGGNRGGTRKTYRNLMLTMLLGGLWHGAGWQFILWGFMHGAYLSLERALGLERSKDSHTFRSLVLRRILVFHCITLTWLPFRSQDLGSMFEYLFRMLAFEGSAIPTRGMIVVLAIVVGSLAVQWYSDHRELRDLIVRRSISVKAATYGIAALAVVIANAKGAQPFIYFQF